MKRFRNLTITTKLTWLFSLFAALILMGVGALAYASGRAAVEQAVTSDLESTANEKQAAFEQWLDDRLNLVVSITELPANRARVNSLIHDPLDDAARTTLQAQTAQALAGFAGSKGIYSDMMIVEARQGQVIVSTRPENQGKFNEDRPYFIAGLTGPFVQNVIYSLDERAPLLIVAAPIQADDGRVMAVLAARLNLDEMNAIIVRRTGLRATDDAFLVNTSNLFVTQPRFITDPAVLQRGVHATPVNRCLTGTSGVVAADDYRGVPVLAAYHWLPERQLCLIVKMDQAEAFAPSNAFGQTLALIAVATLALASLSGFGLARTITTPLHVLQDRVVRFGRGERDVRLPELASDEVGVLAREFNRMAVSLADRDAQLREYAADLEHRVEERTAALRESEERFRSLYENSTVGIYRTTPAGQILLANPALVAMLGYSSLSELGARNLEQDGFDPAYDRAQFVATIEREGQINGLESSWTRRDGIAIFVRESARAIRDPQGQTLYYDGTVEDITDRKQAEEALRHSENNYRTLMEQASDGIFIADPNGHYTDVNSQGCAMLGFAREEILQLNLKDVLLPEDIAAAPVRMIELHAGQVILSERRMRRKDGSIFPAEISGKRLADGRLQGIVRDITDRKQAEEALKANELRFRVAAENLLDVIYEWDLKDQVEWYGNIDALMGFPPGEFPRTLTGWAAQLHPADRQLVLAAIDNQLKGTAPYSVEYQVSRQDGAWRWWSARGTAIRDERGEPYRWIGSITDITDARQTEHAVRKMQTLLNETQEITRVGGWEYDVAAQRVIWTDEVYRIHGVSKDYDPGNPVQDIQFYMPEDQQRIDESFARAIQDGTPYDLELQLVTAAGQKICVRTMGKAEKSDGQVVRVLGYIMDITERKQAEENLRASELRFKTLFEIAPVGISMLDKDGSLLAANDKLEKITRITKGELLAGADRGRKYLREDGTPLHYSETPGVQALTENQPVNDVVTGILTENSQKIWTRVSVAPLNLPDVSVVVITQDITEIKQAQDEIHYLNAKLEQRVLERTTQLQAANHELEAFAYSVSHDLRAPLRAIDGFSRILLEDYADRFDAEGQRLFGIVRANAQKMDQLIIDLLALSRITRNEMVLSRLDMTTLVQAIYAEIVAPDVQAQFTFTVAPLPAADGDATLLRQVWSNLLSNAIKYTLPQPVRRIEVGGYRQGGEHIYFVKDTGVGFNPAYAHKLFGVFQRLHKAEEFEGTGVGLAIVQRIIQRHGGRVWAEGQVDNGATFYFALPYLEADHEPSP